MLANIIHKSLGVSLVIALVPMTACAQNKETLARFAREPHTGPVEHAMVGITTIFRGSSGTAIEVRHGNGMVLRCDGFVLFPAAMVAHRKDEPDEIRPDIKVDLRLDSSRSVCAAPWPAHIPDLVPLRLVKLPNTHTPALRTLLPDTLHDGDALTVVWRQWDADKRAFGPQQNRAVHYAGPVQDGKRPAVCQFKEPIDGAPAGAIVIGPEGLAVGMVFDPGGSSVKEFVSMDALQRVTNCVIPVPTSDSEFIGKASTTQQNENAGPDPATGQSKDDRDGGKATANGMVHISGGPVTLLRSVADQEDEMQGASIACLPPFDIDRTEVTNEEYWNWWNKLPSTTPAEIELRSECWALGWAPQGEQFSEDVKGMPVLGVSYFAAQTFARAHGKRLPTPYEWNLAALGPEGEVKPPPWMVEYFTDRNEAARRIRQQHVDFLQSHRAEWGRQPPSMFWEAIPWLIDPDGFSTGQTVDVIQASMKRMPERLAIQAFSRQAVLSETDKIKSKYKNPNHVLAGGQREFDVSPSGVRDMLFNAHEYVIPPTYGVHAEAGYTMRVNWIALSTPEVRSENLFVTGAGKSENYLPSTRVRQVNIAPAIARWMQIGINIHEAQALAYPLAGWTYDLGPEPLHEVRMVTSTFPWSSTLPVAQHDLPVWMHPVWAGRPPDRLKEIGGAVDIDRLAETPTEPGPLVFDWNIDLLRPIGFRCAR